MNTTAAIIAFVLLTALTLAASLGAVSLRNPVRCGLSLALAFAGIAGFYLLLGAEFVGFIQLLVYVGAVAILIVFAILLTRRGGPPSATFSRRVLYLLPGAALAATVFAVLAAAVLRSPSLRLDAPADPGASIESIGQSLVSSHLLPLQITGLLLTVALIGGVLFALNEER